MEQLKSQTVVPKEDESAQILDLVAALESRGREVAVQPALITADGTRHEVPPQLAEVLVTVAKALAQGQGVSIVPRQSMLTTQEAADLLNISRPTFIKILEKGDIPYEMRGSHRRIRLHSVLDYQEKLRVRRRSALDRMQQQSQEDGLYEVLDRVVSED